MTTTSRQTPSRPIDWLKWLVFVALSIIAVAGAWYLNSQASQSITISVPARDLPMYHLISNTDLMTTSVYSAELSPDAIRSDPELVGRYTRESFTAGKAVLGTQLVPVVDPVLSVNTTVISIPATEAMTFGGRLTSGDIIMLWEVHVNGTTSTASLLLDQALVLDVLRVSPVPIDNTEAFPYVVILAVPVDRQADILSSAAKEALAFTLRP